MSNRFIKPINRRPLLIMMNGLTASGKSTVSKRLSRSFRNSCLFRTCDIRKIMGVSKQGDSTALQHFSSGNKEDRENRDNIYRGLVNMAKREVRSGASEVIILDGSFNHFRKRKMVYELAANLKVPLVSVKCVCNKEKEILKRIEQRRQNLTAAENEAIDVEVLESIRDEDENIFDDVMVDGTKPMLVQYDSLFDSIKFFNIVKGQKMMDLIGAALKGRNVGKLFVEQRANNNGY